MDFGNISWILQLIVCLVYFNGVTGVCDTDDHETPSLPLCGHGVLSVRPGQAIYLDTSGAPDFTKVECNFDISLSSLGSVVMNYKGCENFNPAYHRQCRRPSLKSGSISFRVKPKKHVVSLNCDIRLKIGISWMNVPCSGGMMWYHLDTSMYKATYIKNTSLISDWYACIAITSDDSSISVTVRSYPYQLISSAEQEPSTTPWPVGEQSIPGQSTMTVESKSNNMKTSSRDRVGPIVGGVIGCCGLVAIIVSVTYFILRRKKMGKQSTGKGENAYYLTPIESKENNRQRSFPKYDNNVRNKRAVISLPQRTHSSIQDKDDIHTYEYIDEKYVRVAKVEPMVMTPLLPHQPAVSEQTLTLEQTVREPDLPTHSTVLEPLLSPLPTMQEPVIPSEPKVRKPLLPPKSTVQNSKPTVQNPQPTVQNPKPTVQNPKPTVQNLKPTVQNPKPTVQNPKPTVQNPKPTVQNPKPTVQNPQPHPREDAEGYLQPASKCQAPYSCLAYDKDKSNQEHQYHALQTSKGTR